MKIFLDTLDINLIKKYSDIGIVFGVTTNPTFSKRFNMADDIDMVFKVREALGEGEIHVEAFGDSKDEIVENANRLLQKTKDKNLVFKIPFNDYGIAAARELIGNNLKTNLHLVYSLNQALLAATIKSTYICPLVGRLDDVGHDAMDSIKNMVATYQKQKEKTLVMVSSVRHPRHVIQGYEYGADAITIPPNVLAQMFYHPLTDKGVITFKDDINTVKPISTKPINSNVIVKPENSLQEGLTLMTVNKYGAVAVCSGNRLAGIFTAGDLRRLIQKNIQFNVNEKIEKFMNSQPVTVNINESVAKAKEVMNEFSIDYLIVLDGDAVAGLIDAKALVF